MSGPLGFQYSAWTIPGMVERTGLFASGLRADSPDSQRRLRAFGFTFMALVVGFILLGLIVFGPL